MRSAALAETVRRAFEHESLRNRNFAQRCNVRSVEDARVHVRKQPRLLENRAGSLGEIRQGGLVPELGELLARDAIAQFGFVAQSEKRFLAARGDAGARDSQDLIERQIGSLSFPRRMRERAVVAHVPAELRERNENLARVGDDSAVRCVSPSRGRAHQRWQVRAHQRVSLVSRKALCPSPGPLAGSHSPPGAGGRLRASTIPTPSDLQSPYLVRYA